MHFAAEAKINTQTSLCRFTPMNNPNSVIKQKISTSKQSCQRELCPAKESLPSNDETCVVINRYRAAMEYSAISNSFLQTWSFFWFSLPLFSPSDFIVYPWWCWTTKDLNHFWTSCPREESTLRLDKTLPCLRVSASAFSIPRILQLYCARLLYLIHRSYQS